MKIELGLNRCKFNLVLVEAGKSYSTDGNKLVRFEKTTGYVLITGLAFLLGTPVS